MADLSAEKILLSMGVAVIVIDADMCIRMVNPAVCEMFGYEEFELLKRPVEDMICGGSCREVIGEILHTGTGSSVELFCQHRSGREIPVMVTASLVGDSLDGDRSLVLVLKDISDLSTVRGVLQKTNVFAQVVMQAIQDPVAVIDTDDLTIVGVNQAFLEEYGLAEDQVLGRTCHDVTHRLPTRCSPPDHVCPLDLGMQAGKQVVVEHVHVSRDSEEAFVEVTVAPIYDEQGTMVQAVHISRDITERKRAQFMLEGQRDELYRKHEQLTELFQKVEIGKKEWEATMDCIGAMLLLVDDTGRIRRCNKALREFLARSYNDVVGQTWQEIFSDVGLTLPEDFTKTEGTEIHHDISGRRFHFHAYPFSDILADKLTGWVIVLHDTTELTKISEELARKNREIERSRIKLQEALDRLSSLILQVADNKDFDVQFVNPGLGKCWEKKQCDKQDCPCYGKAPARCWQVAGTFCGGEVQGKFARKIVNCMQCQVYKEAAGDPIYEIGEQFNNMMHILKTINQELEKAYGELKTTQVQLLQQEKMASIGQLAAGVAHEINNPIGFISSNLGTLAKYFGRMQEYVVCVSGVADACGDEEAKERVRSLRSRVKFDFLMEDTGDLIKESLEGTDRVREIVKNLKVFSRVDQAEHKKADINECIESTINIVWNELKYKTTLHKEYGNLPQTHCFPQQLNQVFMNLLMNAAQAIETKGDITIKTWAADKTISVRISDTGSGIPADKLSRIFEPFYTTKAVGKGTGLGLSIAYDIIAKHHGAITVQSEVGRGTTFEITIPVKEDENDG